MILTLQRFMEFGTEMQKQQKSKVHVRGINLCYFGHRDFDAADYFGIYILIITDK